MTPQTTDPRFHLQALERRFPAPDAASRANLHRIAEASARGARKGRAKRWDVASVLVAVMFVAAFVTTGNVALDGFAATSRYLTETAYP